MSTICTEAWMIRAGQNSCIQLSAVKVFTEIRPVCSCLLSNKISTSTGDVRSVFYEKVTIALYYSQCLTIHPYSDPDLIAQLFLLLPFCITAKHFCRAACRFQKQSATAVQSHVPTPEIELPNSGEIIAGKLIYGELRSASSVTQQGVNKHWAESLNNWTSGL